MKRFHFLFLLPLLCPAKEPIPLLGDKLQWAIPAAAFATTLTLRDKEGQEQFLYSAGTSLAVTCLLKEVVVEQRPNGGKHSFPSGHTSSAFQGASFVQKRYGWEFGAPAYALAAYTGWSRVENNKHYTHDVIAGAALGIAASYSFTTPFSKETSAGLFSDGEAVGVRLGFNW